MFLLFTDYSFDLQNLSEAKSASHYFITITPPLLCIVIVGERSHDKNRGNVFHLDSSPEALEQGVTAH